MTEARDREAGEQPQADVPEARPEHPAEQMRPVADGAEPPPRGVRVMGILRWGLLAAVALVAVVSVVTHCRPSSSGEETVRRDRYWCPMHHQVKSPDSGQCPICHMDLVPIPPDMLEKSGGGADAGRAGHGKANPQSKGADGGGGGGGGGTGASVPGVVPVTLTLDRLQLGGVETGPVVKRTVGTTLRLPAAVEAPQTSLAHVHVRTPGFIERVAVRQTGERVEQGQPLAWVYSPRLYQAQLELLAARRWSRPSGGQSRPEGAPTGGDQVAQVAAAGQTALELLGMAPQDIDEMLRRGEAMRTVPLRAPTRGYVVRIQAILGMYATEEMVLYEISDLSRVWVVGSVYSHDLPNIRPGMTARFETGGASEAIEGVVELVEPEVGAATRTTQVRLVAQNPDLRLRPGQYGDMVFDLPGRETLVVPRDAVVDTGQRQYVFLDRGEGRLEPRAVRPGDLYGEHREILEGLAPGDVVVARGAFLVDSESRLAASIEQAPEGGGGGGSGAGNGPDCETAFDRGEHPEAYRQCRECERVHAGMGSMVADCKNAIPGPWR